VVLETALADDLREEGTEAIHVRRGGEDSQYTLRYTGVMVRAPTQVLFLDQYGEIGGGQRILLDLVQALCEGGCRVCVLCPEGPLVGALRAHGAEVHTWAFPTVESGRKSLLSTFCIYHFSRRAAKEFTALAEQSDLIVVNGLRTMDVARRWAKALRKPVLLYLHGVYAGFPCWLIQSFLRHPSVAAIAPSPLVARSFSSSSRVSVIPNWVSPAFLTAPPDPPRLRTALGIADRDPLILVPGRFSPNKGQLLALEAAMLLMDLPCHFVFAGAVLFEEAGRGVERAITCAAEREPARIHLVHWHDDLSSLYDGADVVLVPSCWEEPFGLTAIEAMARRRPLIVTDRGMLPILAGHGTFAEVVAATPEAMASALRSFLSADRTSWTERIEAARAHVEEYFHPAVNQEKVLTVMRSLLL
jgi:glycosyltransferase involved in cell wall biosynthesis